MPQNTTAITLNTLASKQKTTKNTHSSHLEYIRLVNYQKNLEQGVADSAPGERLLTFALEISQNTLAASLNTLSNALNTIASI